MPILTPDEQRILAHDLATSKLEDLDLKLDLNYQNSRDSQVETNLIDSLVGVNRQWSF